MMQLRRLKGFFTERRRSPRIQAKYLQLAYWDGSRGVVGRIREVSAYGAFVETSHRWCANTILQAQLIAELPMQISETSNRDVLKPRKEVAQSTGDPTQSAPSNETMHVPIVCRVVRLVPEGMCVDFMHRSESQRRALESVLLAVEKRWRIVEADARRASSVRSVDGSVQPTDPWEWTRGIDRPFNWARLVAVATLTVVIAWMINRGSHPAQDRLGLQVISRGNQLEIHWNHNAAPIRRAAKGVMHISDGSNREVIQFDATQVHDGTVAYSPKTNDVSVRFEVDGPDGTSSSESVRSVAP